MYSVCQPMRKKESLEENIYPSGSQIQEVGLGVISSLRFKMLDVLQIVQSS